MWQGAIIDTGGTGIRIQRAKISEITTLGAAFLAALGAGFVAGFGEISRWWQEDTRFMPAVSTKAREQALKRWQCALTQVRAFKA